MTSPPKRPRRSVKSVFMRKVVTPHWFMRTFKISVLLMILQSFGRPYPQQTLELLALVAGALIIFSLLVAYGRMSGIHSENTTPPEPPVELPQWYVVFLGLLTILNIVTFIQVVVF